MNRATKLSFKCLTDSGRRRLHKGVLSGLWLLFVLFLHSCAPLATEPSLREETGSFNLFLQPLPQETHRLKFSISELVALRLDGSEVPLALRQTDFTGDDQLGEQKLLLSTDLAPGRYLGLKLLIGAASIEGEEGDVALSLPGEPIFAEHAFTIYEDRAEALFLSLSADRLITNGAFFTPKFSLWKPERILTNLKGFASGSGSQNLTVFNKRTAQVVGAVQVGTRPKGLAIDQRRGWVYVALEGDNSVAVVEVSTSEVLGQIRLRAGDKPTELALAKSGNRLLTLNRGSNSVSVVDTETLFELGRIKLDSQIDDIVLSPDENRAYVIQSTAGLLSVLDLNGLRLLTTKKLDNAPIKIVISDDGRTLYLATDFSADLLAIDTASLTIERRIYIGTGVRSLKRDSSTDLLYVGKQSGEIAIADPNSLMAIDSLQLAEPVQAMTIDSEENVLFVVQPQSNRLLKLDLVSKRQIGSLELGPASHAVVVMGER